MKLLQIYNQYRSAFNGEDAVVHELDAIATENGWESELLLRSSHGIEDNLLSKFDAFWSGIYNRSAFRALMDKFASEPLPDIVHVHNLYPRFSPSVLVACRKHNLPVVMTVHNHSITCPRADHLRRGKICEKCVGGKEIHCVVNNCREDIWESIAYATRSAFARKRRLFHDNVTTIVALTEFARQRFLQAGFAPEQVEVLPNYFNDPNEFISNGPGEYAAFAGRLSVEKGIRCLTTAAADVPDIPVHIAGDGPLNEELRRVATPNVTFRGRLDREAIPPFYQRARFVVVPSTCFEMCPLVISEAMSNGIPVIAADIGGLSELVEDGVTGLLFKPHDAASLATCMQRLWNDEQLCHQLGTAAYQHAQTTFGRRNYWNRLVQLYSRAAQRCGRVLDTPHVDQPVLVES